MICTCDNFISHCSYVRLLTRKRVLEPLFPAVMANESLPGAHASDDAFGPSSSTRDFDFTLTFEQSILTILPSVVLISAGSLRLVLLFRRTSHTLPYYGHTLKTVQISSHIVEHLL